MIRDLLLVVHIKSLFIRKLERYGKKMVYSQLNEYFKMVQGD